MLHAAAAYDDKQYQYLTQQTLINNMICSAFQLIINPQVQADISKICHEEKDKTILSSPVNQLKFRHLKGQ